MLSILPVWFALNLSFYTRAEDNLLIQSNDHSEPYMCSPVYKDRPPAKHQRVHDSDSPPQIVIQPLPLGDKGRSRPYISTGVDTTPHDQHHHFLPYPGFRFDHKASISSNAPVPPLRPSSGPLTPLRSTDAESPQKLDANKLANVGTHSNYLSPPSPPDTRRQTAQSRLPPPQVQYHQDRDPMTTSTPSSRSSSLSSLESTTTGHAKSKEKSSSPYATSSTASSPPTVTKLPPQKIVPSRASTSNEEPIPSPDPHDTLVALVRYQVAEPPLSLVDHRSSSPVCNSENRNNIAQCSPVLNSHIESCISCILANCGNLGQIRVLAVTQMESTNTLLSLMS